ncbi:MAG: hypothetical protein NTW86_18720 [Candidatus Sumerlaeota bacterium]|nr:hypothetical protein [Candidatus Sumerlaeota bacterium]
MRQPGRALDLSKIPTQSVREREARLTAEDLASPPDPTGTALDLLASLPKVGAAKELNETALDVREAARRGQAMIALVGREAMAAGCSPLIALLIERGYLSAVALDGTAALFDFELACYGQTNETPSSNLYGSAREVGDVFNTIVNEGVTRGFGLGEFLGRSLVERSPRRVDLSILAHCSVKRIPATVHPRPGADPVHRYVGADGAHLGKGAQRDFLLFAGQLPSLDGGGILLDLWSEGLGGVLEQALAASAQATAAVPAGWRYVAFVNAQAPERLPRAAMEGATATRIAGDPFLLSFLVAGALAE